METLHHGLGGRKGPDVVSESTCHYARFQCGHPPTKGRLVSDFDPAISTYLRMNLAGKPQSLIPHPYRQENWHPA
ncbi:hypothetical protein OAA27_02205 [bacterium]|nr:hypothetical protein [bacterium]